MEQRSYIAEMACSVYEHTRAHEIIRQIIGAAQTQELITYEHMDREWQGHRNYGSSIASVLYHYATPEPRVEHKEKKTQEQKSRVVHKSTRTPFIGEHQRRHKRDTGATEV